MEILLKIGFTEETTTLLTALVTAISGKGIAPEVKNNVEKPAAKPTKPAAKEAPKPEPEENDSLLDDEPGDEITLDMIKAKVVALTDAGKAAKAKEIFTKNGAAKVSLLAEDKYEAVYKALSKL